METIKSSAPSLPPQMSPEAIIRAAQELSRPRITIPACLLTKVGTFDPEDSNGPKKAVPYAAINSGGVELKLGMTEESFTAFIKQFKPGDVLTQVEGFAEIRAGKDGQVRLRLQLIRHG